MLWWTLRQLRSASPATRRQAASRLGIAGNTAAVAPLAWALKDPDNSVRLAALEGLGRIGDPTAAEAILAAARDSETGRGSEDAAALRAAAASALAALGPGVAGVLVEAARDRNPRAREVAVSAIAGLGGLEAEQVLLSALRDDRSNVRQAAALGLPQAAALRAVEPLAAVLTHKDAQTRRSAVQALGMIAGDEAAAALAPATRDKDQSVREAAIEALGRVGSRRAVESLLALYCGSDRDTRQLAAAALKPMAWTPADERERAVHAILHGDHEAAAREGRAAIEPLVTALADKDPGVRRAAAAALGQIGGAGAAAPLVGALADHEEAVRRAALQSLRRLGPVAFTVVVDALESKAAAVRGAAKDVLVAIPQAPGVVSSLLQSCAGRLRGQSGQVEVLISGADASGRARLAVETLGRILEHAVDRIPEPELRAVAELADLELLDDPDNPAGAERVSSEPLRERARQELERRGTCAG